VQGDYDRALKDLNGALALNPKSQRALVDRGVVHTKRGEPDQALEDLNLAVDNDPASAKALVARAAVYSAQNDVDHALADLNQAAAADPQLSQVFFERAHIYLDHRQYALAIVDADRAAQLKQDSGPYQNARCWTRVVAGRELDLARSACDSALKIEPGVPAILGTRGMVGLKQRRYQEAWNDYNDAVQGANNDPSPLYGRGIAALRLGHAADGQADLAMARGIDPKVAKFYADNGVAP
jgi:tetratricopeptide (TPR) repeat protein